MSPRNRAIAQVRKLWALAKRAGTPEESEAAKQAARRLASKHGITRREVEAERDRAVARFDVSPWLPCTWATVMLGEMATMVGCRVEVHNAEAATLRGPGAARVLREATRMRDEVQSILNRRLWAGQTVALNGFYRVHVSALPMAEDAYAMLLMQDFIAHAQVYLQDAQEASEREPPLQPAPEPSDAPVGPPSRSDAPPPPPPPPIDSDWRPSEEDRQRAQRGREFEQRIATALGTLQALCRDSFLLANTRAIIPAAFWKARAQGLWDGAPVEIAGLLTVKAEVSPDGMRGP